MLCFLFRVTPSNAVQMLSHVAHSVLNFTNKTAGQFKASLIGFAVL